MDRHDEYALADRFNLNEWKRIYKYVIPYKKHVYMLLFAAVGTGIFDAIFPMMTRFAITNFIEAKTLNGIWLFVAAFFCTGTDSAVFQRYLHTARHKN